MQCDRILTLVCEKDKEVTDGAVFTHARYPYLTTVTCAGHATIGTGAFPHRHGMFQNTWWDRNRERMTACAEDRTVKPISYGQEGGDPASPANLMIPGFADLLRTEHGAHVVTLSIKACISVRCQTGRHSSPSDCIVRGWLLRCRTN